MVTEPPRIPTWPDLNRAERAALREILIHGPISRAEISRLTGISKASLTRVTRTLLEHHLVGEGSVQQQSWTGRPSELFEIAADSHHFFGVKLTGDAIYAVITDLAAREVAAIEEPLVSRDVHSVVRQAGAIFREFTRRFDDIAAGGVCLGGNLDQVRQLVTRAHYLEWDDVPLARLMSDELGVPVSAENDVRALTAAEHWFGAAAGCSSMALITIGAGIGFGFVIDDKVVTGTHGRAGRLDHLKIDGAGPVCAEGHRGCAAVYLTSASIVRAIHGVETDYPGAVELARTGHPGAVRVFQDAGKALGMLIGTVANVLDPQKIILTGDGIAVWELAQHDVKTAIAETYSDGAPPLTLDVQPFEFNEWARAAAVVGIRKTLQF